MKVIRILVVDDHPLMRRALSEVISDEIDMTVVGNAINGQDAIEKTDALQPDFILMDLLMPVMDGIQAIQEIHGRHPEIRILAVSSIVNDERVLAAIQAGASGYFSKDTQPEEILAGIRAIDQGGLYLPPEIAGRLVAAIQNTAPTQVKRTDHSVPDQTISAREREILTLVGQGCSNKFIAQQLTISEATVRSHIYHILNKLGLDDRNQAVVFAANQKKMTS